MQLTGSDEPGGILTISSLAGYCPPFTPMPDPWAPSSKFRPSGLARDAALCRTIKHWPHGREQVLFQVEACCGEPRRLGVRWDPENEIRKRASEQGVPGKEASCNHS